MLQMTFQIPRNIGFNVEYITLENPTHQSERLDISNINYTSDLRVNQTARQTDFNRAEKCFWSITKKWDTKCSKVLQNTH